MLIRLLLLFCIAASAVAAMQHSGTLAQTRSSEEPEVARFLPIEARYIAEIESRQ